MYPISFLLFCIVVFFQFCFYVMDLSFLSLSLSFSYHDAYHGKGHILSTNIFGL